MAFTADWMSLVDMLGSKIFTFGPKSGTAGPAALLDAAAPPETAASARVKAATRLARRRRTLLAACVFRRTRSESSMVHLLRDGMTAIAPVLSHSRSSEPRARFAAVCRRSRAHPRNRIPDQSRPLIRLAPSKGCTELPVARVKFAGP